MVMIVHFLGNIYHQHFAASDSVTGEVSAQVATMEEVGANVTKAFLVGDVGDDKDVGDFSAAAFFGERNRFINEGRGYQDRQSVGSVKSVSVRVDIGGGRF